MHHLASLLSKFSLQVKISYQSVSHCTRKRPCFHVFICFVQFQIVSNNACVRYIVFNYFSEVRNRFKYCHNTCFRRTLFSFISLQFQIVSDTTRMHAIQKLFSFFSLQFQIVSNTVRAHALKTMFLKKSLQFQIVSNNIRMHALETLFSKCSLK